MKGFEDSRIQGFKDKTKRTAEYPPAMQVLSLAIITVSFINI
jgi:hypothetical protein